MNKNNIKWIIIMTSIILLFIIIIGSLIHYGNQYTEYEYQLDEINNGVYAIYYTTHSRVPAYNYEVVTLCCNGNIYIFRGDVNISFTNKEPYAKVRNYNTGNNDVYVYIPQGAISYQSSVNIDK